MESTRYKDSDFRGNFRKLEKQFAKESGFNLLIVNTAIYKTNPLKNHHQ